MKLFVPFRLAPHYHQPCLAGLLALACLIGSVADVLTRPEAEPLTAATLNKDEATASAAPQAAEIDFLQISQWHLLGEAVALSDGLSADAAPETQLQLKLLGILKFSDNAAGTHAIIEAADQSQKTYRVKETLPGGVILESIETNKALLRVDNRFESLSLPKLNPESQPAGQDPSLPSQ